MPDFTMEDLRRVLGVDLPEILPGPDGSIDLHWDYPGYEILINISAGPDAKVGFYGDDRSTVQVKGSFDLHREQTQPKSFTLEDLRRIAQRNWNRKQNDICSTRPAAVGRETVPSSGVPGKEST